MKEMLSETEARHYAKANKGTFRSMVKYLHVTKEFHDVYKTAYSMPRERYALKDVKRIKKEVKKRGLDKKYVQ